MKGLKRLGVIHKLSQKNPEWKHKELFRILRKEDIWIAAYENIKAKKVALKPRITQETLSGMELIRLQNLQSRVLNESYKFRSVKQIWSPKANDSKRLLGIPISNDQIVQEVIQMVLEAIYEPICDHRSFDFRKSLNVHDALQYVENQFCFMDWVIEGEIKIADPTVDHKCLCEIIGQRIKDVRFMNLIRKSLKNRIVVNPNPIYSTLGVPQGSIVFVSPLYANIYFNELDKWVHQKAGQIFEEHLKIRNPEYRKLEDRIQKVSKKLESLVRNSQNHKELVRQIKGLIQLRNQTSFFLYSSIEMKYTRYADAWIIGVRGPKQIAIEIKNELDFPSPIFKYL